MCLVVFRLASVTFLTVFLKSGQRASEQRGEILKKTFTCGVCRRLGGQMGVTGVRIWIFLFVAYQVSTLVTPEEQTCVPGFDQDNLILKMTSKNLRSHARLGKVNFDDCTMRRRFTFWSSDSRVRVQTDGTLTVKRPITLHEGHLDFLIDIRDSQGHKHTLPVRLLHQSHESEVNNSEGAMEAPVPVLYFQRSGGGLRRRKRDRVIPPINVPENHKGPYPLEISRIRSNQDKLKKIFYSITGPGADQPPTNLFTMDRDSGSLFVTQQLDREEQANYTLKAYAVAAGSGDAEEPMDIVVNVIDQNDNKPIFVQDIFLGEVAEASPKNFDVIQVVAKDLDEENSYNSDLRYSILSQEPKLPSNDLFVINPVTGFIRVNAGGLDREKYPQYTLEVQAADMQGDGLTGVAKVILTVTDSNDNAPAFAQSSYEASVAENKADVQIMKMMVTDGDEPHCLAWNAKFKIISGDPEGLFSVKTGPNKQEGILSTAKGLDFEKNNKHTLLVAVENEVPFALPLPTATATVVVKVVDVNEAPIFDPLEKLVSKREDLAVDSDVVQYTASDPDTARNQNVMYRIIRDPAGWVQVDKTTGLIKVKNAMDRESTFVKDDKYTALIGAYDNDVVPATGTGTLVIQLEDVNDNAPIIEERTIRVCNKESTPHLLSVTDKDGPGYGSPYSVSLQGTSKSNWTARMNDSKTGIILNLATELDSGQYTVVLRVSDRQGLEQDSTVQATVCDCTGAEVRCKDRVAAGTDQSLIDGVLGGILVLLKPQGS